MEFEFGIWNLKIDLVIEDLIIIRSFEICSIVGNWLVWKFGIFVCRAFEDWLSEFDCLCWRSFEPICLFGWPSLNLSVNVWLFVLKIIGVCICSVCFGSNLLWIDFVSDCFWNRSFVLNLASIIGVWNLEFEIWNFEFDLKQVEEFKSRWRLLEKWLKL